MEQRQNYSVGLFGMPDLAVGQSSEDAFQRIRPSHEFATDAVIALIAFPFVAAFNQHVIAREDSTVRMLRSRRGGSSD